MTQKTQVLARLENIGKTGKSANVPHVAKNLKDSGAFRPIVLGCFTLLEDGLEIKGAPTLDEYAGVGHFLVKVEKVSTFWLADWLKYGDARPDWKERLQQAQDLTGYSERTIYRCKQVGEAIPRARRRTRELSFNHHQAVAGLTPKLQDALLEQAVIEGLSVQELRREVRNERRRGVISGQAELAGMFRVIYADPPWLYNDRGVITDSDAYGRAERHYPGMTIAELCKLPIAAHARPDAVLFLWVTSPFLLLEPGPLEVIKAWGFEYKTGVIWDKVLHNFGHYVSVRHEHLLICTRGSCLPDRPNPMPDSVVTERRGDVHSEKPESFRQLITKLYDGPYLELFARRHVPGWTCWGNQVLEDAQATA